jgi:nitrogen-specific signal transduction histidine kinase
MPARIAVADVGTGISEDQLPFIFDRFRTGDDGQSRGTGLGLPLVRAVARAHGGDVTVRSAFGKGSEFELALPVLGRPALTAAPPASQVPADRTPAHPAAANRTTAQVAEDQGSARR